MEQWMMKFLRALLEEVEQRPETEYSKPYHDAVEYIIEAFEQKMWEEGIDEQE